MRSMTSTLDYAQQQSTSGPDDPPANVEQPCPHAQEIRVLEIGFFFDGTGNNRANTRGDGPTGVWGAVRRKAPMLYGSYDNGESNVSVLWQHYDVKIIKEQAAKRTTRIQRSYVEGIGTTAGSQDHMKDQALGTGDTGVSARVRQALIELKRIVGDRDRWDEVRLDVFGFSRGAAAARYFINCVHAKRFDTVWSGMARLSEVTDVPECTVRFLGVFDTVAAIGHSGNNFDGSGANNAEVNVHLGAASAQKVVHLTARHELRRGFSLNRVTPGAGEELSLTGVHSDVGGGYAAEGDDASLTPPRTASSGSEAYVQQVQAAYRAEAGRWRDAMQRVGWIDGTEGPDEGVIIEGDEITRKYMLNPMTRMPILAYVYNAQIRLHRPWVQPGLNTVALRLMHDKAKAAGVRLREFVEGDARCDVPADLTALNAVVAGGGAPTSAQERAALRNFGHRSDNYDMHIPGVGYPMRPARGGRIRHPNLSGEAK